MREDLGTRLLTRHTLVESSLHMTMTSSNILTRTHQLRLNCNHRSGNKREMEDCIKVSNREDGSAVFVDVEEDGSLLLETLKAQFGSSAIGLRYPFSGSYRSVRVKNGALLPPKVGWGNQTYYVIKEDTDFDPPSVSEDLTVRSDFAPSNSPSSLTEPGTDVKKEFMDASSGLQGAKLYIYINKQPSFFLLLSIN